MVKIADLHQSLTFFRTDEAGRVYESTFAEPILIRIISDYALVGLRNRPRSLFGKRTGLSQKTNRSGGFA